MPDDVELHNALGNELKKLGQLADAETSYRRVIEINPDHAIAHYNLGNVFQIQKRLTAAEACYRRALEIKPDLAEGHNNLGAVLKDLGQFAAAETSYRRALRLKPDSAVTHNNLGNILGDLGQHSAAVESFRRALELQPNSRIIHLQRNPIDTCLSIYFNNLEAHSYANDLDNIAHFYKQYLHIMNHWHESLPQDVILNVPYEELVTDQEGWTRTLLDFIGVSWNECCLDFQKTARRVSTASNWQVRQKISTSSVERWRNYKNFIEPLGVYFPDTWQDTVRE
jgi:tetratricopeptide (TPR) repeat protein